MFVVGLIIFLEKQCSLVVRKGLPVLGLLVVGYPGVNFCLQLCFVLPTEGVS